MDENIAAEIDDNLVRESDKEEMMRRVSEVKHFSQRVYYAVMYESGLATYRISMNCF